MPSSLLAVATVEDLAACFGLTYAELAEIIYKMTPKYRYTEFSIGKRGGGSRSIKAPCRRLKAIQRTLAEALNEIYVPRTCAHGFIRSRSILTNADGHVRKRWVFNLDLRGYFDSIHFGRVRNLFKAVPFNFDHSVATVLAQICCFDNCLPQGAPTSPVVSNLISWKLDRQLQALARKMRCSYTRYADDITFSFTCSRRALPPEIVVFHEDAAGPGRELAAIIEENGFRINYSKVRLAGRSERMEVTGLTVNDFLNVQRRYVRQVKSMLYAWKTFGYEAAQNEHNARYAFRHRPSGAPRSFRDVVRGKLTFLRVADGSIMTT